MSRSYMNDTQKILLNGGMNDFLANWTCKQRQQVHDEFYKKGYRVYALSRFDHTATAHDALIISRFDVGPIMEYLFQQRITVEVEAEGREEVSLILVYNNSAEDVLKNIKRLPVKEEVYLWTQLD